MKTTNNTIFENIHERGYMTEKEMLLLKSRSNKAQKDLFQYDEFSEYVPLSEEWANKGIQWLKSLLKKNGKPKAGQNLGYREIEIIKTATASDFTFVCFYDAGNGWYRNYMPVYNVAGMEYFVSGGKNQCNRITANTPPKGERKFNNLIQRIMTLKELRKMFWSEIATPEMRAEYRTRKTQNDYSTDIRCAWVDFVDYADERGMITEKQASKATL